MAAEPAAEAIGDASGELALCADLLRALLRLDHPSRELDPAGWDVIVSFALSETAAKLDRHAARLGATGAA